MYRKKMVGIIEKSHYNESSTYENTLYTTQKGLLDVFVPETDSSRNWMHWVSVEDGKQCERCHIMHGCVIGVTETFDEMPPLYENCRCEVALMESILAGTATNYGEDGADWWIKHHGELPDYYISRDELKELDWRSSKPPAKYAPGKMLFGGIYSNEQGRLPSSPGRIWYEADLNYESGRRNGHRLYWSNDGLMFTTYNHGETYYEIV